MAPIAHRIAARWAARRGSQAGQGLAEYALILALIAMIAVVAVTMLGSEISATLGYVGTTVQGARP